VARRASTFSLLRGITFTLRASEKLALMGENGAGKTTLVRLEGSKVLTMLRS
jgi:ATP-binding cassette subfamily B protein